MGINSSGVRQIAAAVSTGDDAVISRTVLILRRVSLVLGLAGAGGLIVFRRQISTLTFASPTHGGQIALLSIAVFLTLVSGGQAALIQGTRRIADLAQMQVLGAVFGTVLGIPLVYFLRERGVVPALIVVSATTIVTSWWYSRRIPVAPSIAPSAALWSEARELLHLGFAFMLSGLLTMGVAYAVRVTILRKIGYEATGLYQSAWTLGGLYVGFILQAMGADFYPRLTASVHDHPVCNRLVNEQARVGILLAGPGIIATLTYAPVVVTLFYSAKFGAAVGLLRWFCLGTLLQVLTWPMGYIVVAKAQRSLFIGCEVAWSVVSLALAWVCIGAFGLDGAGIAFFGSYIFHGLMLYALVSRITGFRWSADNLKTGALSLASIAVVFLSFYFLPLAGSVALGTVLFLLSIVYSLRIILTYLSPEQLPRRLRIVLQPLERLLLPRPARI